MNILVTGGAGYVGSVVVEELVRQGYELMVLDNLSQGHRGAVPTGVPLVVGDLADATDVNALKSKPRHRIARNVWVLGASLGGPEAVKRFLRALPVDIPATFILTQHLGANFVALLAEQLDRVSGMRVMPPKELAKVPQREIGTARYMGYPIKDVIKGTSINPPPTPKAEAIQPIRMPPKNRLIGFALKVSPQKRKSIFV